jgi:hypothetical protein
MRFVGTVLESSLVNIPGNPRVKITDPYPYPDIPVPEKVGSGFFRVRVTGLTGLTGIYIVLYID